MMRYKTTGNIEDQYEPGGDVLKNKLGIRSKKAMDELEFEALRKTQLHFLGLVTAKTRLTGEMILAAHKHFLGGLYEWAGKYRTVNISKPGFVWPPAGLVAQNMNVFEKEVLGRYTPCRRGPLGRVAEAIAIVHAEFLLVHPFRDGNGRIARLIADIMALQAGHPPPDFDFRSKKNQTRYIKAVNKGCLGDYSELTELVMEVMRAPKRGKS